MSAEPVETERASAHPHRDDMQRTDVVRLARWSDLSPDRWTLVAAFVMLTLPAISRVDVGWDPAVAPMRRLLVLLIGLVATAAYLTRWRVLRVVVATAGVVVLAAVGWRGAAAAFLLSALFAELVRNRLRAAEAPSPDGSIHESSLPTGLVIVSVVAALAAQVLSQVPLLIVQLGSLVIGVVRVSLLASLGDLVVRGSSRLCASPYRLAGTTADERSASTSTPTVWSRFAPADATPSASPTAYVPVGAAPFVVAAAVFVAVLAASDKLHTLTASATIPAALVAIVVGLGAARPARDRYLIEAGAAAGLAMLSLRWGALALVLVSTVLESGARSLLNPRSPDRGRVHGELGGVLLLTGTTALVGRFVGSTAALVLLCVVALASWHWPDLVRRIGRVGWWVVDAIRHVLTVVGAVLVTAIGVLVVLIPSGVERLVGWDPTSAPRPPSTRFVPRHEQWTDDRRTWIPRTNLLRSPRRSALVAARSLLVIVVGLGLMVGLLRVINVDRVTGERQGTALADSPWWPEAAGAQAVTFDSGRPEAFVGVRLSDVRSRDTNVVDGRRVTWQPTAAPRLRVWMFGGSTTFGLGQRDDHTIASEFAKGADAAGIPIEVTNFGVHGDVHWNETQRLREALASGAAPPDLVVFYDGWNDFKSHTFDYADGSASGEVFRGILDKIVGGKRVEGSTLFDSIRPARGELVPTTTTTLTPEGGLDASIRQYRLGVEDSRTLLAARGIPAAFFLQPTVATRAEPVDGETPVTGETVEMTQKFRAQRPDGVIDLGGVMDGVESPIYFDTGHTNEAGAKIVADAVLQRLLPTLRSLDGGP